jgi:uncharacterized membrane protein
MKSYLKNPNQEHKSKLSSSQLFAIWITEKIGTMPFFYIIFSWTFFWLFWNILAPNNLKFDPSPNFQLWLFVSNMIQIFLMPLLLIGQNIQGKHLETIANNDFEVNLKAEKEIRELKIELTEIKEILKSKSK